ncbi:MAG: MOSC domain-containing protein [Phycisphaeraceae bacterium]
MSDQIIGQILAMAIRTVHRGPMLEVADAMAEVGGSFGADYGSSADRGITFISARQWQEVREALGADLPWHTRRANVLVDADGLLDLVGRTIQVGQVQVAIKAQTNPCSQMDRLHPGLRAALQPEGRAGVYGRIVRGGQIQVGDPVTVV